MKMINNGNFPRWLRVCMFLCGIALLYLGLSFEELPQAARLIMVLVGIVLAAVGGYASQAHMLGLKPFDSAYKKAADSYEKEKDKY